MNKLNFLAKKTGDTLEASEWNSVVNKVDELVEAANTGGSSSGSNPTPSTPSYSDDMLSVSTKGNLTLGSNAVKNINLEPGYPYKQDSTKYGDIALKPGDDIQFCSHHREPKKRDKVVLKNIDGNDNPVKMQVVAGEMELAVGTASNPKSATRKKDKTTGEDISDQPLFKANDNKTLDIKILSGTVLDEGTNDERDERAYLKVRAQAIDLRCEKHGGIALQPKGYDSNGNMNKIKFEHGGGDGLEFGTFNTEKSSLYTDEYRFKKDGIWKMTTRETVNSEKDIIDEGAIPTGKLATGAKKYKKNDIANQKEGFEPADDFYDFINNEDAQTTTKDIINTAAALNNDFIETSVSSKKNLTISAISTYKIIAYEGVAAGTEKVFEVDKTQSYSKDQLKLILADSTKLSDYIDTKLPFLIEGEEGVYRLSGDITPKITIEAEEEVGLDAKYGDVVLSSGDTIKMEAPEIRLNAMNPDKSGGTVNFGSTAEVFFLEKKFTKSGNVEAPTTPTEIKLATYNNSWKTIYWDSSISKFRRSADVLYTDANHTTLYDPTNHIQETPIYFADGTLVPADTTCFVRYNDSGVIKVYKVSTKGSAAVLSKSNDLIATISEGTYERKLKKDGVTYYCSDLIVEDSSWTPDSGLTEVQPEGFVLSTSCLVEDVVKLAAWAKTNNFGPWAV